MAFGNISAFPQGLMAAGVPVIGSGYDLFTPGKVIWVNGTTGNDSFEGTKDSPKASLGGANTAATAGDGDIIIVMPGTYTLTAALSPKKYTKWIPAIIRPYPTVTIDGSIASFITWEADGVSFDNFRFKANAAAVNNFILIADTVDVLGASITRCIFDPNAQTSVMSINAGDATYAMKYASIFGNKFLLGHDTRVIDIGVQSMEGSEIMFNVIGVDDGATGIRLQDSTAITRGKLARIAYNLFVGADITPDDLAITIAGTENTVGLVAIHDNRSMYLAANAATQDKVQIMMNYGSDAATGGTLWVPGT